MTEEWTSRWHITGKNEVIRQWSHEDGQQAYRRYRTTSRPSLQKLSTLDEHIGRFDSLWSRMSIVFVALGVLAILGAALGLFGLPMYGVANSVSLTVGITSVAIIVLIPIVAIFIMRHLRTEVSRLYAEAGIPDATGTVLPVAEGEVLVARSGIETSEPVAAKAP